MINRGRYSWSPMNRNQLIIIATFLFILHTIEEISESFSRTDSWSLAIGQLTHSNSATVYLVGQVVLFGCLGWLIVTRPRSNGWYWFIGGIMVLEFDHVIRSIAYHTYYPGLATAILILLYAIPYFRNLYRWSK